MTTKVIAIHRLTVSVPGADMIHTGRYNDEGEPILKKPSVAVMPGETWDCDDPAEVRYLLDTGAVKLADGERFDG